nr:ribonuclease H-like domain-containing protein [Tanacetum cinerariifolium]
MANTNAESKVFDNSLCSKDCKKNTDSLNSKITDLTNKLFDAKNIIYHYKLGLTQVESRLVKHRDREIKYCKKIRGLELKVEFKTNRLECLAKELETLKKEKKGLDSKLAGFQTASKDLDSLLESQRLYKNKEGLEYSVVPPPFPAQIYSSPKKDMSWTGLLEFKDDTITDYSRPASTANDSPTKSKIEKAKKSPVKKFPTGGIKFSTADMGKKGKAGSSQNNIDDKGYWDSGRSRHMTGTISYLSNYEPFDRGYVSFGQGGCKITGKGTIKSECIVLGQNFKLSDDDNVLLRTPRQHNMCSVDLNNIVPHKDLTCLVAKASADECILWHRRLGHLNFKTMNKLVRHNLVRGLPTKCFVNDHTCTACLKGKQHKASCKFKLVNSVSKLLHTLHMDLFGPTSVSSISHKWYCLVVTDDFSRFTWTFFLKTKDETSGILRKFITEKENLKDLKVKIIRVLVNKSQNKTPCELFNGRTSTIGFLKTFGCHLMILNTLDNLGKFEAKGDEGYFIRYSMSSKAFMVFNKRTRRVKENLHVEFLENKAIEKGAGPNWLFDIDSLTKSMNYVPVDAGTNSTNLSSTKDAASQEVKKDVSSLRYVALPNWVHDALLESSSSKPQDDCILMFLKAVETSIPLLLQQIPQLKLETLTVETPIPTVSLPVPTSCFTDSPEPSNDTRLISKRVANQVETPSLDNILTLTNQFEDILRVTTNLVDSDGVEADVSNMETTITASPTPTLRIFKNHPKSQIIGLVDTPIQTRNKSKEVGEQSFITTIHQKTDPTLLQFCLFLCFLSQVEPKKIFDALQDPSWVLKNKKDERGIVIRNKARLVAQGHTQEEWIDYDEMDVKSAFLYGTIDEEVEFEALMHEKFQMSAMGELNFFLGLQVLQTEDGIFLSQDKYVGDILMKFRYSDVRSSNTPMDKENPWGKDGTGKDVDLHLYRSMIGSLMYLTAYRPDIMCAVCACARHQVTPKECHLHAVKRIIRYLKGHPKLGLWYPKESLFDLVAYSDSDYGGAIQDRKSTTGGCQFLGRRLISWQCKKQTIVATSHFHQIVDFVKASHIRYALTFNPIVYVSHIRQFWSTARIETMEVGTKILATVDGKLRTVSESSIRRNLKLNDEAGIRTSKYWGVLRILMISFRLIPLCLSPKSTGFNEFSSNIATALGCLATNRVYNFSKMIFDGMVKNINNKVSKFLMYPSPSFSGRIVPLFDTMLVPQGEGSGTPTEPHHTPSPEAQQTYSTTPSSLTLPSVTTAPILTVTPSDTPTLRKYTRRDKITQSSALPPVADEPASPLRDVSEAPSVTSPAANEGSMQLKLDELTGSCTSLQRQHSEMVAKFKAHELEINKLKAIVKLLEDREGVAAERSRDDAPIKGRNLDEGEAAAERVCDDTEEMATVLTSMDATTVLASGVAEVPTISHPTKAEPRGVTY